MSSTLTDDRPNSNGFARDGVDGGLSADFDETRRRTFQLRHVPFSFAKSRVAVLLMWESDLYPGIRRVEAAHMF